MLMEFYSLLMSNFLFFWLVIAIFFLLLEMGSPGLFFFLSFFFGAIFAAGSTMLTDSQVLQSLVFLLGSIFSFLVLHFWVKRRFLKSKNIENTNFYALIGKQAKVIKTILPLEVGAVKVSGEIWSAKSLDGSVVLQGSNVEIIEIKGVTLIVKQVEDKIS